MKRIKSLFGIVVCICVFLLVSLCAGCGGKKPLDAPSADTFNVNEDYLLSWDDVDGARRYEVWVTDTSGATVGDNFKSTKRASISLAYLEEGDYNVCVKAVADGKSRSDSAWSAPIAFHKNYESGCTYSLINNNSEYELTSYGTSGEEVIIPAVYRNKPVTSIGKGAFKQDTDVTKITIEGNNLDFIGENAFYRCSNLTQINIPESVEFIGVSAFQACDKITSITLPERITEISDYAFAYCSGLTSFDLTNIEKIGASAFNNCTGLTEINIPDSVISIGERAFFRCISAKKLTIGNGITYIPSEAFLNCEQLSEIVFGDKGNLKSLGGACFANCSLLASVELPSGLQIISNQAFYGDENLGNVTIPDSVTDIGADVFDETELYKNAVSGGMIYADNWLVAATPDCLKNITTLSSSNLKAGIVGIAGSVFEQEIVDESVTTPPPEFSDALKALMVPKTLKYIGSHAFLGNRALWRVVTEENCGLVKIGSGAFAYCSGLSNLVLSEGLLEIGSQAFEKCELLDNNENASFIPKSVERIGNHAFKDTKLYESPDEYGVVYVGTKINYEVSNREEDESWVVDNVFTEENPIMSVKLKESVYGICDGAFYGCTSLKSITGLNHASIVGNSAFFGCVSLAAVALNPNLDVVLPGTFGYCYNITDVSLPAGIKEIGDSAFYRCANLREVYGISGRALKSIDRAAFAGCSSLGQVTLGPNVTELGEYAFFGCESLDNVVVPDGLKKISAHAFSHCYNLSNIDLGNGVEEIGDYAFYSEDLMGEGENADKVQVQAKGVVIKLPDSVKKIGDYAFYGCRGDGCAEEVIDGLIKYDSGSAVTDLRNVTEIGRFAFANANLGTIKIPASLKKIDDYAFRGSQINSIPVTDTVTSMGKHVFNGCFNKKELSLYVTPDALPAGWDLRWNSSYIPIVWGCDLSEDGTYVSSLTITENTVSYILNGLAAPTRTGYEFVGWATSPTATTAEYTMDTFSEIPVGTKVYSLWKSK